MAYVPQEKKAVVKLCSLLSGFMFFFAWAAVAHAGSLYLAPDSGTYKQNQTVNMAVYVSSTDQAINAVSGTITFPPEVTVLGVSKGGTIANLWPREPSVSGNTVSFQAVILNPGYTGGGGKILNISVRPTAIGTFTAKFSGGSVLANDGNGTNVLSGLGGATFTVKEPEKPPPGAPVVTSQTHPDPALWYKTNAPQFDWKIPGGVTAVSVILDQEEGTTPDTTSEGLIATKTYTDLKEGIWYMHVRFKNEQGWGPASHTRIRLDSTEPEGVELKFPDGLETNNQSPVVIFTGADATSGLDHFLITIDGRPPKTFAPITPDKPAYHLEIEGGGRHAVLLTAVDRAGNEKTVAAAYTLLGVPLAKQMVLCLDWTQIILICGLLLLLLLIILYMAYRIAQLERQYKELATFNKNVLQFPTPIPIRVFNQSEDLNLTAQPGTVQLTISTKDPSFLSSVSADDFEAFIDLKSVSGGTNTVKISVASKNPHVHVVEFAPEEVKISLTPADKKA